MRWATILNKLVFIVTILFIGLLGQKAMAVNLYSFGDSIATGYYATATCPGTCEAYSYPSLTATSFGYTWIDESQSGGQLSNFTDEIYGTTLTNADYSMALLGFSDARAGWEPSPQYESKLGASLLWMLIEDGDKIKAQNTGAITYVGTWANVTVWTGITNLTRYSNTIGDTATITLTGSTIYVAYIASDDAEGGSFTLTVDGNQVGETYYNYNVEDSTVNCNYSPQLIRVAGLANTAHTVVVTVTSATSSSNKVWLDFFAESQDADGSTPNVWFGGTLRMNATGYTLACPRCYGSDNLVNRYNVINQKVAYNFKSDGWNIKFYNPIHWFDIANDIYTDNIHPDASGHQHLADMFISGVDNTTPAIVTGSGGTLTLGSGGTLTLQ